MKPHTLPLAFSLDPASPMDTLEAILATARRGGLDLIRLSVEGAEVALTVSAADPDRLDLFRARLDNLWGIVWYSQKVARMHVA